MIDIGQKAYLQHKIRRKYDEIVINTLETAVIQFVIFNESAGGLYRCFYSSVLNTGVMLAGKGNTLFSNGKVVRVTTGSFLEIHEQYTAFNRVEIVKEEKEKHDESVDSPELDKQELV